jgi:hypothetical protein
MRFDDVIVGAGSNERRNRPAQRVCHSLAVGKNEITACVYSLPDGNSKADVKSFAKRGLGDRFD